jgi:proline iminopeptidase
MKSSITTILSLCLLLLIAACSREDISQPGALVPMTTDQDDRLAQLSVNGIPLHLETFGDISKPIMILLHGGPGMDYRAFISEKDEEFSSRYPSERRGEGLGMSALQEDYFLVVYDRRGSGLSPRFPSGGVTFDHQLSDLKTIIEHFLEMKNTAQGSQEDQVYLFGWSFGGYLATAFTNEYPELIKDLILYEARPFNEEVFQKLSLTSPFAQLTEDYVDAVFTGSTYILNQDHETADYQWAVGATGDFYPEFHNPAKMPFWRLGFIVNQEIEAALHAENRDVVSKLDAFQGKTLYLYGSLTEQDAILPGYLELVTSYFPDAEATRINNTGHYGPWEEPAQIIQVVSTFLN